MAGERTAAIRFPEGTTVGDSVRLARVLAGLSRKELARALEVSEKTLQRIEDDTRELRLSELMRLAELTGQDLSFFGASVDEPETPNLSLLPGAVKDGDGE